MRGVVHAGRRSRVVDRHAVAGGTRQRGWAGDSAHAKLFITATVDTDQDSQVRSVFCTAGGSTMEDPAFDATVRAFIADCASTAMGPADCRVARPWLEQHIGGDRNSWSSDHVLMNVQAIPYQVRMSATGHVWLPAFTRP